MLVEEHIEKRGVRNPEVLRAVRGVPRHEFVPADIRAQAYDDKPLPIGYGATISQPYIVAAMTELLEAEPHHRVLEIGTGSGYQSAVLSGLVQTIYSVELVPELAVSATETLARLGYGNVIVRSGDGYNGWPEHAPFDRVIVTAAPPQLPETLLHQLKPGGKLVVPVGGAEQHLMVFDKLPDGTVRKRAVFPVMFVPMRPAKN
ncbi:MAG TPA: protein-L-isoaspartate(D-aspartate) O-methyltransferase [Bryobacteraceae bacterium]|nr:protein-L-isoaspartate(D-aspartate) O-methyltransferase [Bryobacteraceae bacterium]